MNYTIEDLKKLIESMSGSEKRHFSITNNIYADTGKQYLYVKLFHALSDPDTEFSEFKEPVSLQAHTSAKRRLFKNILNSLRSFHDEASIKILIQKYLSEIEILYNHNLPRQSIYILKKAYKLAVDNEDFDLLLQVLEWESKLDTMQDTPSRPIETIIAEEQEVLRKLTQVMHLKNIYNKSKAFKKYYGYTKGNVKSNLEKETIQAAHMIRYKECASQKARFYFNFIYSLYYRMTDKHIEAYTYSNELIRPEMQVVGANDYIDGILQHVVVCASFGQFEDAFTVLAFTNEYMQKQKLHRFHILNIKFIYYEINLHLIMYNYMGNPGLLQQAIKSAEEKMVIYEDKLSLEMKQVILGNLMNAYLGMGDFKKMDGLWHKNFSIKSIKIRNDINGDLYLFRLFSMLQSEIYDVLASVALSAHRYYNQSAEFKKRFELEIKITAILVKEHNWESPAYRKNIFIQMKSIFTYYINKNQKRYPFLEHYTRYVIWISSIISKRLFHEEAAIWYQQFIKNRPLTSEKDKAA